MILLSCQFCKENFETTPFHARSGKKYCSKNCKYQMHKTIYTPNKQERTCPECKIQYWAWNSKIAENRGIFCSKKCKNVHQERLTGELSNRYGIARTIETRWKISTNKKSLKMDKASRWKGGRIFQNDGYVSVMIDILPSDWIKIAQEMTKARYILEHRIVAAVSIGRPLTIIEVVHHRNGIKWDNRAENLMVQTRAEHTKKHREFETEYYKLKEENKELKQAISAYSSVPKQDADTDAG